MGFLEQRLPDGISYGSVAGPGFDTRIAELDSGQFQKIRRRSQARREYDVSEQVKDLDDLIALKNFYLSIGGTANGFRFKDWTDYTTASDDRSSPTNTDQFTSPSTGDGSETNFQMAKVYSNGSFTHTRTILKPVANTTVVSLDGVNQTSGFSVNTATGIITFTTAPANGVVVKYGCEFDVPVSFGDGVDQFLGINLDFFDGGSIPSIPIIEELNPTPVSDQEWYGGTKPHGSIAATITITAAEGRLHSMNPTVGGLQVKLQQTANLPAGGPYFAIANTSGSNSIEAAAFDGTAIITINANSVGEFWLIEESDGTKTWVGK